MLASLPGCAILSRQALQPSLPPLVSMDFPEPLQITQKLRARWQNQDLEMLCVLELDGRLLDLVCVSPLGIKYFSIKIDSTGMQAQAHPLSKNISAESILADLQLSYWPLSVLQAHYGAGWVVIQTQLKRQLYFNESLVADVDYDEIPGWESSLTLNNHRYHYSLSIENLAVERDQ